MKHSVIFFLIFFWNTLIFAQSIETPVIQSVTIDHDRHLPVINWTVQTPGQIDGFIVKRLFTGIDGYVDGTFNTIATINNRNQVSFTDTTTVFGGGLNTNAAQYFYRIASFKNVGGNIEYSDMSLEAASILVEPPVTDICEATVQINWTPHTGWGEELESFVVKYGTSNIYPDQILATLAPTDTTLLHTEVPIDQNYYYVVEAVHKNGTIQPSNIVVADMFMPNQPQFLIADYATVSKPGEVSVSFSVDAQPSIQSYKLMEKMGSITDNEFRVLAEFENTNQTQITYTDIVPTNTYAKEYKLVAVNICGDDYMESNIATNIVVFGVADDQIYAQNNLRWNLYQNWINGIERQEIYRQVDNGPMELIATLTPTEKTYTDDVSSFAGMRIDGKLVRGQFCYTVVAYQAGAESSGISHSNIGCVQQRPRMFIPNAFNPNSQIPQNRVFFPVMSFLNNYTFIVYNRWGEKLFETNSVDEPWNGTGANGQLVQQGTYVYYIKYQYENNEFIEETGHITVVY